MALLAGAFAAALALFAARGREPQPALSAPAQSAPAVSRTAPAPALSPAPTGAPPAGGATAEALPAVASLEGHSAAALARYRDPQDRTDRELAVSELVASGEPAALAFLIDELRRARGPDRELLLRAVIDFGSRDAIPALLELAETSEDPASRADLAEAAKYLALPSLSEFRRGQLPLGSDAAH